MRLLLAVCIMASMLCGCREKIMHNLSERDANSVLTTLSDPSIEARKEIQTDGNWVISVASSQTLRALQLVDQQRTLRPRSQASRKPVGLLASREEQLFQYERSLSEEIEETLLRIEGVLDVRLHLNLPVRDPLLGRQLEEDSGGSALIIKENETQMNQAELAKLIAGAAGLDQDKVHVVLISEDPVKHSSYSKELAPVNATVPKALPSSPLMNIQLWSIIAAILTASLLIISAALKLRSKKLELASAGAAKLAGAQVQ